MRSKVFKVITVLFMILTMTMTNFIFVGNTLISYALSSDSNTNNKNIEFNTYFKNEKGEQVSNLDMIASNTENMLYISINVKQEGYLDGTITLEDGANFRLLSTGSQYIESTENNTLKLNTITAGTSIEIPVKIEPIKEEQFNIGLLNVESKLTLNGTYKDSSEKNKEIKATKKVQLNLIDGIVEEDVINEAKIITNKIFNINGEEKRVVQLSWDIGFKNHTYPIKNIVAKIQTPISGAEVEKQINLNTMTSYTDKYENDIEEITLNNDLTEGNIKWKKEGAENIILTYIYDKNVDISKFSIQPELTITLYNQKEITAKVQLTATEEKDAIVQVSCNNQENEIYKGKIVAGIERPYVTKTEIKVNLAKAIDEINLQEKASTYKTNENEQPANTYYVNTAIEKAQFNKIFGKEGYITILNQDNQEITTINNNLEVNENGYFIVNYNENEVKEIKIKTSKPIAEGTIELSHTKKIKETQSEIAKSANSINTVISYKHNQCEENNIENSISLKDTTTESRISISKDQLSTVIENSVEIRATLLANNEQYDLYKNPSFNITLPKQVENINITNISKLYDDNNEFSDPQYTLNGNTINVSLSGAQTNYTTAVEGITIVIEAQLQVNKFAATSDEQIKMEYYNENAFNYANNGISTQNIKITAPKEITTVNSIKELSVETIGEEEKTEVIMEKGAKSKQVESQLEIINSNATTINNVKILGNFPTNNSQNNMDIAISSPIQVENAKVYYTSNENATEELENAENAWTENLNGLEAKKYLIALDKVDSQSSVKAAYKMEIPENLEYNKTATEGYIVKSTNSETGIESTIKATDIVMKTGVGPKVETTLKAVVGSDTLENNAIVKNGEVIKYQINISNTGSEDISEVTVMGQVPEGTKLVQPMENYEYTGAAYYKETDITTYEAKLENLKVGEKTTLEYEVRVNSDLAVGSTIKNETQVKYGEVTKTNSITNINETANLRVSLKQVTNRATPIYLGDYVEFYAIIENISQEEQKDVKVRTNLSNNVDVLRVELIKNMKVEEITDDEIIGGDELTKDDNINEKDVVEEYDDDAYLQEGEDEEIIDENIQKLTYQQEMNIGDLKAGESKVLCYVLETKATEENVKTFTMSVDTIQGKTTTRSNLWGKQILYYNVEAEITTNTTSQYVNVGDEIDYTITLKNKEIASTRGIKVIDEIPSELSIQSIIVNGEEEQIPENANKVGINTDVEAQSTTTVQIKTFVDYNENEEAKAITNKAVIEEQGEELITTDAITHIIKPYIFEDEDDEDTNDNNQGGDNENGENQEGGNQNIPQGERMVTGIAWLDANSDGRKDASETLLSNIKVKLLNTETNKFIAEATTNENGIYILQNIAEGKYIVVFEYDTAKYTVTKYQAEGIPDNENSNALINELTIDEGVQKVAATDIITISENDISNINIGLIELKNFDLKLDKYVSRILIQDTAGATVREYGNADIAKVELDAKRINGSTVIIEYNIVVTNVGEVEGYAKKIVDYMPNDLNFSSEMNKDWYQNNGILYNASIANDKIQSGETKKISLTLTKSMTENNTGLIKNTAEIAEDYNELGLLDSNSTPGNKKQGENDMSSSEVILSIRTGGVVYVSLIIVIVAIIGTIAFIIIKNEKQIDDEII